MKRYTIGAQSVDRWPLPLEPIKVDEMITYILEREYDESIKVQVEDDTIVTVNSYENHNEGIVVKFDKRICAGGFETTTIAAFSRVKSVRQEEIDVQIQKVVYDDKAANIAPPARRETKWVTA